MTTADRRAVRVPLDERVDRWFDDHPGPKVIRDGLALLALGALFLIGILALSGWEPKP